MNTKVFFGVLALMLIIAGTTTLFRNNRADSETPVCSQETLQCPDGTVVARAGSQCEFAPCPNTVAGATFTGTIKAYSTGCFADGICSVTVDDKVVIVTQGFRVERAVGKLVGVSSISDIGKKIGHPATVYAHRTSDTQYTLYGNSSYYVEVH